MGLFGSGGIVGGITGALFGSGPGINVPKVARPDDPTRMNLRDEPRGQFETMLRERALQQGPSAQGLEDAGRAKALAQGGVAQGFSNLAQRGGASAGARERLQKQANLQGMLGQQQAYADDARTKLGLQADLAKQGAAERQYDVSGQNDFNMNMYKSKLGEFAGAREAQMQADLAKQQRNSQLTGALIGLGGSALGGYMSKG